MKNFSNFFGSTTVGKKGQVVIPMEIRKIMKLSEGEKLLVFGVEDSTVVLTKFSQAKEFVSHLEKRISKANQIIGKSK